MRALALASALVALGCGRGVVDPTPDSERGTLSPAPPASTGASSQTPPCFVGGCSGQLCTDDANAASTCEWLEAYGCFKSARCERQADGACGWTVTAAAASCLSAAGERCGGIAGFQCRAGWKCVDDPNDDCDPSSGGADCMGVCTL